MYLKQAWDISMYSVHVLWMTEWMVTSLSVRRSVSGHCVERALSFILFRSFFWAIFPAIRVLASSALGVDWGKEIFYLILLFSVRYSVIFCAWVLRCRALWSNFFWGKIPGVSWGGKTGITWLCVPRQLGERNLVACFKPHPCIWSSEHLLTLFLISYLIKIYIILNNEKF